MVAASVGFLQIRKSSGTTVKTHKSEMLKHGQGEQRSNRQASVLIREREGAGSRRDDAGAGRDALKQLHVQFYQSGQTGGR